MFKMRTNTMNICFIIIFLVFVSFAHSAPPNPKLFFKDIENLTPDVMKNMALIDELMLLDPDIPRMNYVMQKDGIEYILVLRIDFSDQSGVKPAEAFNSAIFGTKGTSMRLYFEEVSYGQMKIMPGYLEGVMPKDNSWYRAKKKMSYYGAGNIMTERYRELVVEACNAADPEVDFSKYDRDGDGFVDHLMIIHAGNDEASTGVPDDIWSASIDSIPGIYDGTKIQQAIILAEDPREDNLNIGIFCHEFFHEFGAPDLYSWDYPVGHWCLMGMFGPYQDNGQHPSHICGYLKWDFDADISNGIRGWIEPIKINIEGNYSIDSFELSKGNRLYRVDIPGKGMKEYFLIENRNKNSGTIYDTFLPESGIIIMHIDEKQPKSFSNPHRVWVEDPSDPDRKNTREATKGAAYSLNDNQTSFTPATYPNSNANDGTYSGIIITDIGPIGTTMTFSLFFGDTFEPNDSINDAYGPISYKKQYISFIKDEMDKDFYKFYAETGRTVIVYLENIPKNNNYSLQIYDSQKNIIETSDDLAQENRRLSFKVAKSGIYYVAVVSKSGYSQNYPYILTLESVPIDLAPSMIVVSKIYPNPGPGADGQIYFDYKLLTPVEKITLEIYTINGELIYKYNSEPVIHSSTLSWNTEENNRIASGVYIYTIKTELNGKIEIKTGKLAIIR